MKCNPSWLNYFWLISLPHLIEDIFAQHFLLLPHADAEFSVFLPFYWLQTREMRKIFSSEQFFSSSQLLFEFHRSLSFLFIYFLSLSLFEHSSNKVSRAVNKADRTDCAMLFRSSVEANWAPNWLFRCRLLASTFLFAQPELGLSCERGEEENIYVSGLFEALTFDKRFGIGVVPA